MSRRYRYYYDYYERRSPIETDQGIKARSQRGKFAQSWWAERWIHALERLMDAGRLRRGRRYARSGQVLSIEETPNGIIARVQGTRRTPYKVTIRLTPLTDEQWERVTDRMAEQAIFVAQLLAGQMPQNIEEAFKAAGVSLFPDHPGDLITDCTCPDWANPCKHIAATHYILGEQFDEDPFLIFRLRGRTREQILDALRARHVGDVIEEELEEESEAATPLEELMDRFWVPLGRWTRSQHPSNRQWYGCRC
ncbi:MAG: SWIM zinc finger family protein [Anaerolineae bacterium]|nr:SWIM zinc finger family protein [Anaerolineae bacterium]